jgi:hypothetical protein
MMGLRMESMAIGACFSLTGRSGEMLVAVEGSPFFRAEIFCSIMEGSSLKVGLGFDRRTCVKGMCSTVHELSTPMASGGIMDE